MCTICQAFRPFDKDCQYSGINGQGLVVNAGMDRNYFDKEVVKLAMRPEK